MAIRSFAGLNDAGFVLVPNVLSPDAWEPLDREPRSTRCLLDRPWCADFVSRLLDHPQLRRLIPPGHAAVQCTYFEKSPERNWLVALHQDLSIPVATRVDAAELRGWAEKEGELYVQAPAELLAQLIAVRVSIDRCSAADGALRVVPGSHTAGILDPEGAAARRDARGEVLCELEAGDALVMRPLLLHASSKSRGSGRRRVLHFLFGPRELPHGLRWRTAVPATAYPVPPREEARIP